MSLKDVYQRFLANHESASLASDASLIYIPTTTKLEGPDAVLRHFSKQQNIIKTKAEDILGVVEGADSLCLDVETTLEFVAGGGAYLPSLDNNFLLDRVASFPTVGGFAGDLRLFSILESSTNIYGFLQVHIVRFNGNRQIQNIRIYWDQASLLRQVEVIGSRSRGWPIRDAKDQTRLIKSAIAAAPADVGTAPEQKPSNTQETKNTDDSNRPRTPAGRRHIRDPYAAESLTDLLSPGNDRTEPVRAPRSAATAKPPPRDLSELFVGDDNGADEPDASPSKSRGTVAPKVGAGRNFQHNRLFDDDETVAAEQGHQQVAYRVNPNRFSHFDIGADNSDREIQEKPVPGRAMSRHTPQWGFGDFMTPEKPRRPLRGQEINQFPWSDVEPDKTPQYRQPVAQPRRDANVHFELTDTDNEPKNGRIIGSFQNKGLNLYRDPILDGTGGEEEEEEDEEEEKRKSRQQRNNQARFNLASADTNRHKNFDSHWYMSDASPGNKNPAPKSDTDYENQRPVGMDRMRSVQMMEAHWETHDESPKRPSVAPPPSGVRNAYHRSWDIGDE